ncbi:response regulator transcription factor [Desulfolithobacter sp.]
MRVLLVDDEKELVSTLAERLSFRGIAADWVTSGADALREMEENEYDIAVLDVKMPGMGGLELAREIRSRQPDLEIIFLTGHGSKTDFDEGVSQAGEGYYLAKPVDIEILVEKMNAVLG